MSFEIHLNIPEDSDSGQLIASVSAEGKMTASQAVKQIVEQAARRGGALAATPYRKESPAELSAKIQAAAKLRPRRIPKDVSGSEAMIGMLDGDKEFGRIMDAILAERPERYGFEA